MTSEDDNAKVAARFGAIARQYCVLVDAAAITEKTEFLLELYRILPELVLEAIRLPDIDGDEEDDPKNVPPIVQRPEMSNEEWGLLYGLLKGKFGSATLYWTVFNPLKDEEAIPGSLADDVADVYRDLLIGVLLIDRYAANSEAIWEWRFGFHSHWGDHAISALRTIHWLLEDKLTGLE
jgi:hypothetical protein